MKTTQLQLTEKELHFLSMLSRGLLSFKWDEEKSEFQKQLIEKLQKEHKQILESSQK